jgi:hypothetical protein
MQVFLASTRVSTLPWIIIAFRCLLLLLITLIGHEAAVGTW